MSIVVTFRCDGCPREQPGRRSLRRRFVSFSGRPYGIGTYRDDSPEEVVPPNWVAFDPYTQATYCPACWAEIVNGSQATERSTP